MTAYPSGDSPDLLELPADDELEPVDGTPQLAPQGWRRLLSWSSGAAPLSVLLIAGFALGPRGISLLPSAMPLLDPVVPVALAALGVLLGLAVGDRRTGDRRLPAAAVLHSVVVMLAVAAGIGLVAFAAMPMESRSFWTLTVVSGICAATALTLPSRHALEPRMAATRLIELGALLPIVAGGLALAVLRAGTPIGAVVLVAQASGVALMLAAAGWLLLTRASSETEERVFAVSALLLVGGVADALALSALFVGLIAGVFWRIAGRRPRDTIRRDVLFVQHPLLVLVLLLAGARAEPSPAAIGLAAAYVAVRVAAHLAAGALARRVTGAGAPEDLGRYFLAPGVFGVAFALNAVTAIGDDASIVHAAVVAGTIGSELVAVVLRPRRVGK